MKQQMMGGLHMAQIQPTYGVYFEKLGFTLFP